MPPSLPQRPHAFVAFGPSMHRVCDLISHASSSDVTVLIVGEVGTGKECVAREIHASTVRRTGAFVSVHCTSLPEAAAEAEFFGVAKEPTSAARAGVLHAAVGGTLFVSDITELSVSLQFRLLCCAEERRARRVGALDDEPVDVRLVAAAHTERPDEPGSGSLRHDLYRQRNVLVIDVPPLRERRDDIIPLARVFLARARTGSPLTLTSEVARALEAHRWPGNVRELESVIARAVAVTTGAEVTIDALPESFRPGRSGRRSSPTSLRYREMLAQSRERASREYFVELLKAANGNVKQAAEWAGVERETLHRLLKRFGVNAEEFRAKPA